MRLPISPRAGCAVLALAVSAATAAAAAAPAAAAPSDPAFASPVVGHVYVNDNTAPVNTIAAFDRHADGALTPVPGAPFATGAAGTGSTIGAQGALQETDNGRYLLAVDPGSNQISVLRIEPDGTLRLREVVSSGGLQPVSIAVHRRLVYVANAGNGASNYTGFWLGRHGRLHAIAGSTVALPDGSSPGDVLFNSNGSHLAGTRVGSSEIDSFDVGPDGRLTAAAGSPFAAQGPGPFGSEFRPTDPNQLFVTNAHGGTLAGSVSAFSVAADATLTPIGASPFADRQTAPCWVEISHDGRYLFAVNTASGTVSSYWIARDGSLRLLASTPVDNDPSKAGPFDARLSPSGTTLWVVDNGAKAVSAFRVFGGYLHLLGTSPTALPGDAAPFGIVVN